MDRALDALKETDGEPGYREVVVSFFDGRFRVRGRQTWPIDKD